MIQDPIKKHLFRADSYRILALGFEEPSVKNLESIQGIIDDLLTLLLALECSKNCAQAFYGFAQNIPKQPQKLTADFYRLFHTHVACPPSEGTYQPAERGPIIGDVSAFYEAFQMKAINGQGPPDSIKMELGFMSFMALKTVYAFEKKLETETEICLEAQKKFLFSHLGRWTKVFSTKLREQSKNAYYHSLASLLERWIDEDCQSLNVSPVLIQENHLKEEDKINCC